MVPFKTTASITDINQVLQSVEREARERPAALVAVGGDFNGRIFDLTDGLVSLGRHPDNAICIEKDELSRFHMLIRETVDGHTLEDCGSRNGTFLNGNPVQGPEPLARGDLIKAGSLTLQYLPKGDPERLIFDKLSCDANTDGLTGCFNKAYFHRRLQEEVKRCRSRGGDLALIMLDLDHFKAINDNHGHDAGDYVLRGMAAFVREMGLRGGDLFARYGGEEFVILLPGQSLWQAMRMADRMRLLIEKAIFNFQGVLIPVTLSAGVAEFDPAMADEAEFFRKADQALLRAKSEGRNRVVGKTIA